MISTRRKRFRKGSKTMTTKLNYEDPTGQVRGTSPAPVAERVNDSSRRRIVRALEAALSELIMHDEGSRRKD